MSTEYDRMNRPLRKIFYVWNNYDLSAQYNSQEEITYDRAGRVKTKSDFEGNTTSFEYDLLGRLTKVTDALGNETGYTYDERGHKLTETDAKGNTTSWGYDHLGRMVRHTLPLGMSEYFSYNERGNRTTRTDFENRVTDYEYDPDYNRLESVTYEDQSGIDYTYTPRGRRHTVTDTRGVTTYEYDISDRVTKVIHPVFVVVYAVEVGG